MLAAELAPNERRGFELREVAGGWRFYTRPEHAEVVERFVLDGQQARLTQAALETLAVVAYRQPVSRGRVAAVRGVNVDGVMRTLRHARPGRGGRHRRGQRRRALPDDGATSWSGSGLRVPRRAAPACAVLPESSLTPRRGPRLVTGLRRS